MYTSGNKDTNYSIDISNSVGTKARTGTPETAGSQTASETSATALGRERQQLKRLQQHQRCQDMPVTGTAGS